MCEGFYLKEIQYPNIKLCRLHYRCPLQKCVRKKQLLKSHALLHIYWTAAALGFIHQEKTVTMKKWSLRNWCLFSVTINALLISQSFTIKLQNGCFIAINILDIFLFIDHCLNLLIHCRIVVRCSCDSNNGNVCMDTGVESYTKQRCKKNHQALCNTYTIYSLSFTNIFVNNLVGTKSLLGFIIFCCSCAQTSICLFIFYLCSGPLH